MEKEPRTLTELFMEIDKEQNYNYITIKAKKHRDKRIVKILTDILRYKRKKLGKKYNNILLKYFEKHRTNNLPNKFIK